MILGLCAGIVGLGLGLGAPRRALAAPASLAIPRVETTSAEPALAEMLTRLLREEVERLGRYRSIGTPRLGLREMMASVDCANDSPRCLALVGRELGTAKLVLGKLDRVGDRYLVTLQLFDVALARVDLRLQRGVVGRDALLAEFPRLVRHFLGLKETEAGTLEVTANQPGVRILVDGADQGEAPLKMERVPIGEYRIEARKPGLPTYRTTVRVDQDRTAQVAVVLGLAGATPIATTAPAASALGRVRWYTWTLLGVGAAGVVTGGALGAVSRSRQSDFDAGLPPMSSGDLGNLEKLAQSGKRLALAANVSFGVGGAALLAGTALLIRDLRSSGPAERAAGVGSQAQPRRATARPFITWAPAGGMAGVSVPY